MAEDTETIETDSETKSVGGYNPNIKQRFAFEIIEAGEKFETAHVFNPLTEERYLKFLAEANVKMEESEVETTLKEAFVSLWSDLISEVENIETENDAQDWKTLIDSDEKISAVESLIAVAVIEPDGVSKGKRKLVARTEQTITTEAFNNGLPVRQTHRLAAKNLEWSKKYDRIQTKRFKQENTKGLKRKPKIIYVPQDAAIGELYDEMLIESAGFEAFTPLRFKTQVLYYAFASKIDEKK